MDAVSVIAFLYLEEFGEDCFAFFLNSTDDVLKESNKCIQLIENYFLIVQKYKDPNAAAEMNSLKYAQKMIDLRLSYMQNNKRDTDRDSTSNLPIIPLDELLNKNLTLFYYLDYLSVLNLQRYVLFYLSARGTICITNHIQMYSNV